MGAGIFSDHTVWGPKGLSISSGAAPLYGSHLYSASEVEENDGNLMQNAYSYVGRLTPPARPSSSRLSIPITVCPVCPDLLPAAFAALPARWPMW